MVLNPVIEAMLEPYCGRVRVVPWGMDSARFPWPVPEGNRGTLFMAAVAGETIKGYHVAHEACRILRETRSDFELVVTFDPPGPIDEFTRSVGWCSLAELPRHYRDKESGRIDEAARAWEQVVQLSPSDQAARQELARLVGAPVSVGR